MQSQIDKLRSVFCGYVVDKALAKRLVPIVLLRPTARTESSHKYYGCKCRHG